MQLKFADAQEGPCWTLVRPTFRLTTTGQEGGGSGLLLRQASSLMRQSACADPQVG